MEQIKTKLIELAKKVGFGAVLMQNVAYKAYPDLEPIRYYLWMCELQKWCREKYNFTVTISEIGDDTKDWHYAINLIWSYSRGTYEQTLEEGLYQTLLLIQEENEKEN